MSIEDGFNQASNPEKEQFETLFEKNPKEILETIGLKDGSIDPLLEAAGDKMAITSVVEGKRDIGYLSNPTQPILSRIQYHELHLVDAGIDKNGDQKYVFYRNNAEGAKQLAELSKKYGGYLSKDASLEEQIIISNLLDYKMESTLDYIKKNNKQEELKELYFKKLKDR